MSARLQGVAAQIPKKVRPVSLSTPSSSSSSSSSAPGVVNNSLPEAISAASSRQSIVSVCQKHLHDLPIPALVGALHKLGQLQKAHNTPLNASQSKRSTCAKMENVVLANLSKRLLRVINELRPDQISLTVSSLAALNTEQLGHRARQADKEKQQDAREARQADKQDGNPKESKGEKDEFCGQGGASSSSAQIDERDQAMRKLFDVLLEESSTRIPDFRAQSLSMIAWTAATVDLLRHRTIIFKLLAEIHSRLEGEISSEGENEEGTIPVEITKRPEDITAGQAEFELSSDTWTEQDLANIAWVAGKAVRVAPLECKTHPRGQRNNAEGGTGSNEIQRGGSHISNEKLITREDVLNAENIIRVLKNDILQKRWNNDLHIMQVVYALSSIREDPTDLISLLGPEQITPRDAVSLLWTLCLSMSRKSSSKSTSKGSMESSSDGDMIDPSLLERYITVADQAKEKKSRIILGMCYGKLQRADLLARMSWTPPELESLSATEVSNLAESYALAEVTGKETFVESLYSAASSPTLRWKPHELNNVIWFFGMCPNVKEGNLLFLLRAYHRIPRHKIEMNKKSIYNKRMEDILKKRGIIK